MLALKPRGSDANPLARLCGGARDSRAVYDDAERVKPAAGCQGRLVESAALMLRSTPGNKNTQNTLKRLGVNHIPGIEEVNFFRDDGSVIHFKNPKSVQASIGANTYVIRSSPVRGPPVCALHVVLLLALYTILRSCPRGQSCSPSHSAFQFFVLV
jgi:hypothetical protein